jgi:hypothetical protein
MAKGIVILVIVLIAAILTSAFVVIGVILFANLYPNINGGPMETYQESFTYTYESESPSDVEDLNLKVDIGEINIEYSSNPSDPIVKAVMEFDITAPDASSKDYTEWFEPIVWQYNNPIIFELNLKPSIDWSLLMENELTVTLRTDIVYGIEADSITGGVQINIPNAVSVEDLNFEVVTGSISVIANEVSFTNGISFGTVTGSNTLDLIDCVIRGDIVVEATTGDINFDIYQEVNLNANVDISVDVVTGDITGTYEDTNPNVGARFSSSVVTGDYLYISSGGFSESGNSFTSNDYPATYNYDVDLGVVTGGIQVEASSL